MQISDILAVVNDEISRLEQVRDLLSAKTNGRVARRPRGPIANIAFPFGINRAAAPKKRHNLSAAGRARIAAAQKARWAKLKKANAEKQKNGKK